MPKKPKKGFSEKIADEDLRAGLGEELDPVGTIAEWFGSVLWDHQKKIVEYTRDYPRVAWRSCHGIGKSYVVARLVLWWLYSFDYSIVLTTAPTWRQVEKIVWKEIRSCHANSIKPLGGTLPPRATQLSLDGDEWAAIGLSTNDPNRFQGFHARHLLVIIDEGAGVADDIYEAVDGVLTSDHCRIVVIGNPTDIGGQFYRAFRPELEAGWKTGHTSAFETPNFTAFNITIEDIRAGTWQEKITGPLPAPWLITPAWVADKYLRWGENHPAWFSRVLGEFPRQGQYNVIPLSWVEQAQERWLDQQENDTPETGRVVLGVDVARGGDDLSAIAIRRGSKIISVETFKGLDGPELAGEAAMRYREHKAEFVNVDSIGLGAAVVDAFKDPNYKDIKCNPVNVAVSSEKLDEQGNRLYQNLRSELWWRLREDLDPKNPEPLSLPTSDTLMADLASPLYDFRKGWTQVEPKEETKKRLGRSMDEGDAVMLTGAELPKPEDVVVLNISTTKRSKGYNLPPF